MKIFNKSLIAMCSVFSIIALSTPDCAFGMFRINVTESDSQKITQAIGMFEESIDKIEVGPVRDKLESLFKRKDQLIEQLLEVKKQYLETMEQYTAEQNNQRAIAKNTKESKYRSELKRLSEKLDLDTSEQELKTLLQQWENEKKSLEQLDLAFKNAFEIVRTGDKTKASEISNLSKQFTKQDRTVRSLERKIAEKFPSVLQ